MRCYTDESLPKEGLGWTGEKNESPWVRLPDRFKDVVSPEIWGLSRNSAGVCYRFVTNSSHITIQWKVSDPKISNHIMAASGRSGVDVYGWSEGLEDDIPNGCRGKAGWCFVQGPRPMDVASELSFGWRPGRPCMVYLPLYNNVEEFSVYVDDGCTIEPLPARRTGIVKPVVYYGTSITHGAAASRPGLAWTAIASRLADVPFINLGFAGNGKMDDYFVDILAELDSSCYVLDCLWNMTPQMVSERFEPFVRRLLSKRPNTPMLLAEDCHTFRTHSDKGLMAMEVWKKLQAEGYTGVYYIPNTEQMKQTGEETVDNCHPNDIGMMNMGIGFAEKLKVILKIGGH